MKNTIDLHIHSTASDGTDTPLQIVEKAIKKQLKYISLTDHESIEGYKQVLINKNLWNEYIKIIPGVELHTFYKGYEVHLLGYHIDIKNVFLNNKLELLRKARTEISYNIVQKFNDLGYKISWDQIKDKKENVAITKAHIISELKKLNTGFNKEIFYNYFHPSGENYIPFIGHPLEEAIELIKKANGIPVLAHPGLIGNDDLVKEIISRFKIGLEVYYHYFGDKAESWRKKYERIASAFSVIKTGGSDYHGSITPVEIGDTYVPADVIYNLNSYSAGIFEEK